MTFMNNGKFPSINFRLQAIEDLFLHNPVCLFVVFFLQFFHLLTQREIGRDPCISWLTAQARLSVKKLLFVVFNSRVNRASAAHVIKR